MKKNNLAEGNPELAKEWHPTLNGDLTPEDVACASHKKVWWQCNSHQKHIWMASVGSRYSGIGCPYCSNQKVLQGYNDLATTNPSLASEWHSFLNGELTPADVTAGSNKKVWWICTKHKEHTWITTVGSRSGGRRCPYCSNQKILPGYNDLHTTNPELSKEWHLILNGDLMPLDVMAGSNKKIWWQCVKHAEHQWMATISSRNVGSGCPYCINQKVLQGYNDLATINPELAKEWHPTLNGTLKPNNIAYGSDKKVWWLCKKGHEWKINVYNRNNGSGCPKCNAETQTSFPEQAIYYYLKQELPVKVENRASVLGVEVDVYIPSWGIGIEYDGLYFHESSRRKAAENKKNKILFENGIHLIRIKESLEMTGKSCNSIYCVYDGGYKYLEPILNILAEVLSEMKGIFVSFDVNIDRDSFKIAEQFIKNEKRNSLAIRNSALAAEWHPTKNGLITPEQITCGSNKKVWWQCVKHAEHQWQANVNNRNNGRSCPYCSSRTILPGHNDLETNNPKLAKEWHSSKNGELTPREIAVNSNKRVWWRCDKLHEWQTSVSNRSQGKGCPYCSNKKVWSGYNDLATTHVELSKEWHHTLNDDLTPFDVVAGSNKKVWWECEKGHEWIAKVWSRTNSYSRCPECAKLAK